MAKIVRNCLQSAMKATNFSIGIVGLVIIFYSAWWLIVIWDGGSPNPSTHVHNNALPLFMFGALVMGTVLIFIALGGHAAAATSNRQCLSGYAMIVLIFLLMETMVTANICLNTNWVHDFPSDPTGGLDDLKDLIEHSEICKWVAFLNFASQGCSMLLSALLRCLDTEEDMDNYWNHDHGQDRLPLLNPVKPPAHDEGLNVKVH
ncbi:hypothetical protein RJ641_002179 [Dillenia turbinata]|uniref:Tetraspanin-19 n=1 Tax=Dillenia turbinata TaxID=194707 RepID=A0AAN8VEH5_9MAGN